MPVLNLRVGALRLAALTLLLVPAVVAVQAAIGIADTLEPWLDQALSAPLRFLREAPEPLQSMLVGPYGVLSMLPFLVLYALPTLLLFSVLVWWLQCSGLLTRTAGYLSPWLQRVGLSSDSLIAVVMGFGCNVPAILQTRQCGGCERCAASSAIAFGSACSYQLPATLAVFAAAGHPGLVFAYLPLLVITTLIYLRATQGPAVGAAGSLPMPRVRVSFPPLSSLWPAVAGVLGDFARVALPVFVAVCLLAGLLEWSGALSVLAFVTAPLMSLFHLPEASVVAVLMGAIRKDGIAIGLLAPDGGGLKVPDMTAMQVLTVTYLASVLLPCLVTQLTLWRELGLRQTLVILRRQVLWAVGFSVLIGWSGWLVSAIGFF